ncbi:hypothetical protein V1503_23130 [Bacillus sp. SCS-151]|uniref:hypothetical protein n=2 Tax=Bacillales TaxID=1385 RepID=UPI002A13D7DC|nr:hypothetical protein [Cytobacillus sp. IB215316]
MELKENMQFEITTKFVPNFYNSKKLKVVKINASNVRIEMENAKYGGVFPLDLFQSLIRNGALLLDDGRESEEDTA